MGLLGSAFRVSRSAARTSYRTGRTTYRAGKSISRGRVPNLGVNVGVGGLGVRVGTKGLSVKTPVARVSAGTSGFRLTAGKPGIAHVTVNPTRPSVTAGAGPLRVNLSKHPGVGLRTGMIGLGVTTKPLVRAQIGGIKFSLPGELVRTSQRWHEQVDQQWRADYQRRPPSFLASLHDLICEVESNQITKDLTAPNQLRQPHVTATELTNKERKDIKKTCTAELHEQHSKLAVLLSSKHRKTLKEKVATAITEEQEQLSKEQQQLQHAVDEQFALWSNGDPALEYIVLQASFNTEECPAYVINHSGHSSTIAVIAPDPDDVHPEKPSYTSSGAKTVKKKTKKELQTVYRQMVTSTVLQAINIAVHRLPSLPELSILVIERSASSTSLETFDVIAKVELTRDDTEMLSRKNDLAAFEGAVASKLENGMIKTAQPLHRYIGNNNDNDIPALLVDTSTPSDLQQAAFWLEAAESLNELTAHSPTTSTEPHQPPPKEILRAPSATTSTPTRSISDETEAALTAEKLPNHPEIHRIIDLTPQLIASAAEHEASDVESLMLALFDALIIIATPDEINNISNAVDQQRPAVNQLLAPTIQRIRTLRDLKQLIVDFIAEQPDIVQSTLPAQLNHDPSDVRRICWYLEHFDLLTRVKKGRSYSLTLKTNPNSNTER